MTDETGRGPTEAPDETAGPAGAADPAAEGPGSAAADAGGEPPVDALEAAERKAEAHWNRYLEAAAELDNLRKRAAREVDNARRFAIERFAGELLPVVDSLEMGLAAAQGASAEDLLEGTEATLRLLHAALNRSGVEAVEPGGEPFDPQFHEAMSLQPAPDAEPGSVVAVVQKGYTLNGRLLRPARVIVAADPPAEPAP